MRRFSVIMVALVAVGCGGGGSDGPAATPTPTPVNIDAPQLPNTLWSLTTIDGAPAPADPPTKVSIGLPDQFNGLQVSGLCKTLFGKYVLKGAAITSTLEPGDAAADCTGDAAAYRQSIMEAINGATAWAISADRKTLTLTGAKTLVLTKA